MMGTLQEFLGHGSGASTTLGDVTAGRDCFRDFVHGCALLRENVCERHGFAGERWQSS